MTPLIVGAIFELSIIGIAYFNADEVNCNFLWCEFKTTHSTLEQNSECYQNGIKINCSDIIDIETIIKSSLPSNSQKNLTKLQE